MRPQLALACLAPLALTSCATLLADQEPLLLTSDPAGATFTTSDGQSGVTPAEVTPRDYKETLVITLSQPGFGPATVQVTPRPSHWIWGSVVFGAIPVFADILSESAWVLPQDELHVALGKLEPVASLD